MRTHCLTEQNYAHIWSMNTAELAALIDNLLTRHAAQDAVATPITGALRAELDELLAELAALAAMEAQ